MRNWIIALSTATLVLGVGCKKKEEPKKEAPPAAKKEEKKPEEAKPADPKAEEKKPEEKKPEEAKPATAKPEEKKPEEAKAPTAAAGPMWGLDLPADVIGIVGTQGLDKLLDLATAKATAYGLPQDKLKKDFILEALKGAMKLSSLDWLATDKPIRAFGWNPKKAQNNAVVVLPIKGKDALIAALPAEKKAAVDGNEFSFEHLFGTWFVNFIDGHAVLTMNKDVFAQSKAFTTALASKWTPKGIAEFKLAGVNLRTIFGAEIRAGLEMAKSAASKLGEAGSPLAGLEKFADFAFDLINTVVDESDGLSFAVELDDKGNITLPVTLDAKAGGKIAGFSSKLGSSDLSFAKNIPAEAWFVSVSHVDPKSADGLMAKAMDLMAGFLKFSDEEKTKFADSMKKMMELTDGQGWFGLYPDGAYPLAMGGSYGVLDGAKYRELADQYMSFMFGKLMGLAKDKLPPQLQALPTSDFKALIAALNAITSTQGLKLEAGSTTDAGVTVQSLTMALESSLIEKLGAEGAKWTKLLGTKLEFAIAYGPKHMGFGIGPKGVADAKRFAGEPTPGPASAPGLIASRLAKGMGMVGWFDFNKMANAAKPLLPAFEKEGGPVGKVLGELPAGLAVGFYCGGEGNTLKFGMDASLDALVKAGKTVAEMTMRKREDKPANDGPSPAAPGGGAAPAHP